MSTGQRQRVLIGIATAVALLLLIFSKQIPRQLLPFSARAQTANGETMSVSTLSRGNVTLTWRGQTYDSTANTTDYFPTGKNTLFLSKPGVTPEWGPDSPIEQHFMNSFATFTTILDNSTQLNSVIGDAYRNQRILNDPALHIRDALLAIGGDPGIFEVIDAFFKSGGIMRYEKIDQRLYPNVVAQYINTDGSIEFDPDHLTPEVALHELLHYVFSRKVNSTFDRSVYTADDPNGKFEATHNVIYPITDRILLRERLSAGAPLRYLVGFDPRPWTNVQVLNSAPLIAALDSARSRGLDVLDSFVDDNSFFQSYVQSIMVPALANQDNRVNPFYKEDFQSSENGSAWSLWKRSDPTQPAEANLAVGGKKWGRSFGSYNLRGYTNSAFSRMFGIPPVPVAEQSRFDDFLSQQIENNTDMTMGVEFDMTDQESDSNPNRRPRILTILPNSRNQYVYEDPAVLHMTWSSDDQSIHINVYTDSLKALAQNDDLLKLLKKPIAAASDYGRAKEIVRKLKAEDERASQPSEQLVSNDQLQDIAYTGNVTVGMVYGVLKLAVATVRCAKNNGTPIAFSDAYKDGKFVDLEKKFRTEYVSALEQGYPDASARELAHSIGQKYAKQINDECQAPPACVK